jgi:hypothetical protein
MVVAVDCWGSCIADGSCIQACRVSVFDGIGQKIMCKQWKWLMPQVLEATLLHP